jgi:FkbM family methyltransferase
MAETQIIKKRPEDRRGLKEGSLVAGLNIALFRLIANRWRTLPNFRGKVRFAKGLKTVLGLDNRHIVETVILSNPKFAVTLDLHSWHEFLAYIDGDYETETVHFLARCYNEEGIFIDVGANIGLISLPFASIVDPSNLAASPFIFCIEAVKSNYEALVHNIELNRRQNNIIAIKKGVGERDKTVEIQVEGNLKEGEGTGTGNILPETTDHRCERIPLTITTLDALRSSGEISNHCSLMKIDVDGYDFFVLQGAKQLMSSSRPLIFGEFNSHCLAWHGHSHDDVARYVGQFDYEVFSKTKAGWKFIPLRKNKVDQDLLLVPKEKLVKLSWCCEL